MKKLFLLFCFIFASSQVFSQIFTENFDYVAGTEITANGWTAFDDAGTNPIKVTSPGLTYTDLLGNPYIGSGIGNAATVDTIGGEDDGRFLSVSPSSGSVYSSMMLNISSAFLAGAYFFGIRSGTSQDSRLYARGDIGLGGYNLGLEKSTGAGVAYAPGIYTFGITYLVIVKYTFATPDEMSLFVFSPTDIVPATEPPPTFGPVAFPLGTEPPDLDEVFLRQTTADPPNVVIDGIYVDTEWNSSVLPVELSSFTSTIDRRDVTLNWTTSTETNHSGFDIERSMVNGQWSRVGNVSGNGTSTTPHSYSFTDRGLATGNYNYRLKQIDFNGNFSYFNLSNEVNVGVPSNYDLSQNYPNPFNPSTKINYDLPFDGNVSIKLFDMSGKEVATLVNEVKTAGYYSVNFNASNLSSGVYFYTLRTNDFTTTKSMLLVK